VTVCVCVGAGGAAATPQATRETATTGTISIDHLIATLEL
jgi:hypothetical protein